MGAGDVKPTDTFAEKLAKILPAEVTAVFLAIKSIIDLVAQGGGGAQLAPYVTFAMILLLAVVTPIFLQLTGHVQRLALSIFLSVSFLIWSVNIEYSNLISIAPAGWGAVLSFLIPILLILWAGLALPVYLVKSGKAS
jgi:hypothetical protein